MQQNVTKVVIGKFRPAAINAIQYAIFPTEFLQIIRFAPVSLGKKDGKSSVEMSEEELNAVIDFNKMSQQMALAVEHLKQEYIEQVTLRTSVGGSYYNRIIHLIRLVFEGIKILW